LALFGYNLPQRFLILDGTANGGKGTFVRIIQALVGVVNTYQLRTECLQDRFETFRYRGKTLLIGPDVAGDFLTRKGASMLKVLVGGDPISAEGKGLNGDFAMFGTFNIVVTCNSRLRVRLEDDASAWPVVCWSCVTSNRPRPKGFWSFIACCFATKAAGSCVGRWRAL
jgi:phage/plasmid-associated DNA primase